MGFQPGSTCLRDPETQLGKISRAMRIRIDTDQHTLIPGVDEHAGTICSMSLKRQALGQFGVWLPQGVDTGLSVFLRYRLE